MAEEKKNKIVNQAINLKPEQIVIFYLYLLWEKLDQTKEIDWYQQKIYSRIPYAYNQGI